MIEMRIPKEIADYTEKSFLGLSWRQLLFAILAVGLGGGLGIFLYFGMGLTSESSLIPGFLVALPFWAMGFLRPFGLKFEEALSYYLEFFFGANKLPYKTDVYKFSIDEEFPVEERKISRKDRKGYHETLSKAERKEKRRQSEHTTGRFEKDA